MKQPSIKTNWIYNVCNKLISYIVPLIVTPYVSRLFGAEGIGIYSYTTANVTYFVLFCMLGIEGYGQRLIAINRDNQEETSRLFWELAILHAVTSLVSLVSYGVLIVCFSRYRTYYLINFITVFAAVIDFNWFFVAYERFKFISMRNCILKILTLVLTFGLVHTKQDLALYIGINVISVFFANFFSLLGLRRYIKRIPMRELHWRRHVKEVVIYFVPTMAASVYSILDKSVINWITGSEAENGYYEQAYKIMLVINAFVHSLETVSAPRMSNLFVNGTEKEFRERLNYSVRIMLLMAIPCAFGVAAIAPTLIPIFLGSGFDRVVSILYVFMPLVIIIGFSVYLDGLYLVPSGQRGKSAIAVCIGAACNVILNIVFIIRWGAFGAAIATLLTEGIVTSIMMYLSRKMIEGQLVLKEAIRYGFMGFIMFIVIRCVSLISVSPIWSLLLQVSVGICCYLVILMREKNCFRVMKKR